MVVLASRSSTTSDKESRKHDSFLKSVWSKLTDHGSKHDESSKKSEDGEKKGETKDSKDGKDGKV